jgi:polysaccharide biosynthesis protein PslG
MRLTGVIASAALLAAAVQLVVSETQAQGQQGLQGLTSLPSLLPLLWPAPDPPAKAAPNSEQFGVNVNLLFNTGRYSAKKLAAQLAAARSTGATVARSDALWEAAEPNAPSGVRHHFDWTFDDRVAGSLASHGLRWLAILDYSARWAQSIPGEDHSPPKAAPQFAVFAAAFAARYGTGGTFWHQHPTVPALPVDTYEIWNEPDNPVFWRNGPNPAGYASLYRSTRDAVLAVDPAARVIIGGLTDPQWFLPAMLRSLPDLAGHIDGVAIHPYGATPYDVLGHVRTARATLDYLGLANVPLYVTEFGWTTRPAGALDWAPAQARPSYITGSVAALGHTNCGIAAVDLYTWTTPRANRADPEDWFGISPPKGGTSADTIAFVAGLRQAVASAPSLTLCP